MILEIERRRLTTTDVNIIATNKIIYQFNNCIYIIFQIMFNEEFTEFGFDDISVIYTS